MTVLFFMALLASSEYYEYCSNPACNRLGQNAWLILAIMQVHANRTTEGHRDVEEVLIMAKEGSMGVPCVFVALSAVRSPVTRPHAFGTTLFEHCRQQVFQAGVDEILVLHYRSFGVSPRAFRQVPVGLGTKTFRFDKARCFVQTKTQGFVQTPNKSSRHARGNAFVFSVLRSPVALFLEN